MSKRKLSITETPSKKPKLASEDSSESENLTPKPVLFKKGNVSWPDEDIHQLLANIEENIPKIDKVTHKRRLELLDWDNVSFKTYTVDECKEVFSSLQRQVRKFRYLSEIVADARELLSAPKKRTVLWHPEKPKQPPNNFMLFVEEKRCKVMEENPSLSQREILKILGQKFRDLSDEEREFYSKEAKQAHDEYITKVQDFYKKHPEMANKKDRTKSSDTEEPGVPPKPKTPFQLFMQEEMEKEEPTTNKFKLMQASKVRWGQLTDKDKYFWINWADELFIKYKEELKEYVKEHPQYKPPNLESILTKNEVKIKEKCRGKPEKPPHSGYHLYCKMILESEDVEKMNRADLMTYVSDRWKSCSSDEKNEYNTRLKQLQEEYNELLEIYANSLPIDEKIKVLNEKVVIKNGKKDRKVSKAGVVKKPETPPSSVYKYYVKIRKAKGAIDEWESLNQEEKNEFEAKWNTAKRTYIRQYEQYLNSLSKEDLEKIASQMKNGSESESYCSEEDD